MLDLLSFTIIVSAVFSVLFCVGSLAIAKALVFFYEEF